MKFRDQNRANTQFYVKTRKEKTMGQEREGSTIIQKNYNGGSLIHALGFLGLIDRPPFFRGVLLFIQVDILFDKVTEFSSI